MLKQTKLVEQIKAQEAQLETAKKERDGIILQLQSEQAAIIAQAAQERARLAEQAEVAKRIQQEKEQLEEIKAQNQKITEQAKSEERQLEVQVKQEKAKLASQAKLLRTVSSYEKFLESSKQKQAIPEKINLKLRNTDPLIIEALGGALVFRMNKQYSALSANFFSAVSCPDRGRSS